MGAYLVPTAEAAPYTPTNGVVFNNAAEVEGAGAQASRRRWTTRSAPPRRRAPDHLHGMYLFSEATMLDRLIAAHKRGVNVQLLIDNGADGATGEQAAKALGTSKAAAASSSSASAAACRTTRGRPSTARSTPSPRWAPPRTSSIISSANPHGVNIYNSWNNSHTIVNNAVVYTAMRKYFLDMTKDRSNHNYGNQFRSSGGGVDRNGIITSGKYQITLFPRRPARIAYLDVLNSVSCRTATNYGQQGTHSGPDGHVGLHQPADGRGQAALGAAQRRLQGRRHDEPGPGEPHDHATAAEEEQRSTARCGSRTRGGTRTATTTASCTSTTRR